MQPDTETVSLTAGLLARADSDDVMVRVLSADTAPATDWRYRDIIGAALVLAARLRQWEQEHGRPARVGLLAENSPEWVTADLATLFAGAVEIPVPTAFAAEQAASLFETADLCLVDAGGSRALERWSQDRPAGVLPEDCPVTEVDLPALHNAAPATAPAWPAPAEDAVVKVIHTSGTTSAPKGVRIRRHGLNALLTSLRARTGTALFGRYLSIVPLSLLIEQVAGLYMPFLAGGSVTFLPPGTALVGTAADAAPRMLDLLRRARPTALVIPPTVAGLFLALCDQQPDESVTERHMRIFGHEGPVFVACGGAPVPAEILQRLHAYGLTVHEGYGLSENSSVVSWNFPGEVRFGTVGRPLDHVEVELAEDGELLIRSTSLFAGYTREDPSSVVVDEQGRLHTGDLAEIDEDGYLRITGRKKSLVITAGGRNVSPEWVEARYRELGFVREAAIVADGLEAVHGLFVVQAGLDHDTARARIETFGRQRLSDIERAAVIRVMAEDDPDYARCFTVTGRPRRDVIRTHLLDGRPSGAAAAHTPVKEIA
ncbi:AMP-binding protein [Streptomyces brasiliensis]|uniref:Long-chain acyl-CoA synthetase n=1 Tax=Streptomyces brasiliensis TaxID=1954 RepID=A0A917L813_9ACTN|nr:AMP-binding protein [Streptomyces brasiliensis]GGJ51411.1 long-chain acyl-CoA synthetase [Streptomyces brasiliensis]